MGRRRGDAISVTLFRRSTNFPPHQVWILT